MSRINMAFCLFLGLGLLVSQVQSQPGIELPSGQTAAECYGKAIDWYFILDSSTSIYVNDYSQVLLFARDVASRLDISQQYSRVGLVTFSDDITRPGLELNRFQSKNELLSNINEYSLPYRTGVTNTDAAIRYVRQNTQFREDVTKIMVVVTDGGSRQPGSTAREADLSREQGFYVYVVGVGQYQDEQEWRNIASDPDDSFIFNVTYRGLDQVKVALPSRACVLPPLGVFATCNVQRNTEVFFVAGPGGTQNAVQIIDKFVEATQGTATFVRVSYLMGICSNAENVPVTNLNRYCDRSQSVGTANQNTYIQLLSRLRTIARQSRRGAKQVAVLFLDEESLRLNRGGLLNEARNVAETDNIEIIAVDLGTTRSYNSAIQGIASSSQNVITFAPGSASSQRTVLKSLIDRTCQVINGDDFWIGQPNRN